jgi:hypothetical protein
VGTLLVEGGVDIDTVRRWLGQKTLAMAIHYSETVKKFDPLGSKKRTKLSNSRKKCLTENLDEQLN